MPLFHAEVFRVRFKSNDGTFCIFSCKKGMTYTGSVSTGVPSPGDVIPIWGNEVVHPKFGKQVEIEIAPYFQGDSIQWSSLSTLFNNAGLSYEAAMLAASIGEEEAATAIKNKDIDLITEALRQTSGISDENIKNLVMTLDYAVLINDVKSSLAKQKVPKGEIKTALDLVTLGCDATPNELAMNLLDNIYLLSELGRIDYKIVESLAYSLKLENAKQAWRAAFMSCLRDQRYKGHTNTPLTLLNKQVFKVIKTSLFIEQNDMEEAVRSLWKSKKISMIKKKDDLYVYIYYDYICETHAAEEIKHRISSAYPDDNSSLMKKMRAALGEESTGLTLKEGILKLARTIASKENISPTDEQLKGVVNSIVEPVSILTGRPGAGKSTSMRFANLVAEELSIGTVFCAPTGIAAKRLSDITGHPAYTIHKTLGATPQSNKDKQDGDYEGVKSTSNLEDSSSMLGWSWLYDASNRLHTDILFVDEASMIDQNLLYRILFSTSLSTRIVFIGDPEQLPSVSAGDSLRQMIDSGIVPVTNLKKVFRQKNTSDIVDASNKIYEGEVPHYENSNSYVVSGDTTAELAHYKILSLAEKLSSEGVSYQILSPRHKGYAGVTQLNKDLRERLNPKTDLKKEVKNGKKAIRVGDKVMFTKNNPELNVYNGSLGTVTRAYYAAPENKEARVHVLLNEGTEVVLTREEFYSLRLAYAITIHKSQGSEFEQILVPIVFAFKNQLKKNLFYTAITRAKKVAHIIGDPTAVSYAIQNQTYEKRRSLFSHYLTRVKGVTESNHNLTSAINRDNLQDKNITI